MIAFQHLDKRVQRTKVDLYRALFELLKKKEYEYITIKEIIDLAGYSRGTFYVHYNQKDDLLNEIIDYLFNEASKAQRTSYIKEDSLDVQLLDNEPIYILNHFKQYGEYYKILLGENVRINFRDKLANLFVNLYLEDFEMLGISGENGIDKILINKFQANGLIGVILDWVIEDFPTEPEVFSKELVKIFKYSYGTIQIKKKPKFYDATEQT